MDTTIIKAAGISCQGCVDRVIEAIGGIAGVRKVEVSLERGETIAANDLSSAGPDDFRKAVEDAGFKAR